MSLMEKGERNVTSSITNHIILGVINKHAAILLRKVFCVICVIYLFWSNNSNTQFVLISLV